MRPLLVHQLSWLASGTHADWITLDGGALLLVLATWVLAAAFGVGSLALVAAASFPQPTSIRTPRARQALVCFALALLFGFGLPVFFEALSHDARDALANWALLWVPAVAIAGGLFVRRVGQLG